MSSPVCCNQEKSYKYFSLQYVLLNHNHYIALVRSTIIHALRSPLQCSVTEYTCPVLADCGMIKLYPDTSAIPTLFFFLVMCQQKTLIVTFQYLLWSVNEPYFSDILLLL